MPVDDADVTKVKKPRNEVLFREGDPPGSVYFLLEGAVEVVARQQVIARVSGRGEFFGEMSALLGIPRTATVRTLAPSEFLVFDSIEKLLRSDPGLALKLARVLADRLRRMNDRLISMRKIVERADRQGAAKAEPVPEAAGPVLKDLIESWDTNLMTFRDASEEA